MHQPPVVHGREAARRVHSDVAAFGQRDEVRLIVDTAAPEFLGDERQIVLDFVVLHRVGGCGVGFEGAVFGLDGFLPAHVGVETVDCFEVV